MEAPMKPFKAFALGIAVTVFLAVLIVSAFSVGKVYAASCFTDTGGHWAESFICWMKTKGLSSGYPDGTYRPDNGVTRAEMATFLKAQVDLPPTKGDIYISTGPSNWVANALYPAAYVDPYWAFSHLKASSPGTFLYSISPSLPSSLYDTKMYVKGAKLCYDATDVGAYITAIELKHLTYNSSGYAEWNTKTDTTDLTNKGCQTIYFTSPSSFWGNDQVTINVYVTITNASYVVRMGVATVIITPSTEPAMLEEGQDVPAKGAPPVDDATSGK